MWPYNSSYSISITHDIYSFTLHMYLLQEYIT
nr:MAG TPA: hypothetical protein [Caudoviricetes sp.]